MSTQTEEDYAAWYEYWWKQVVQIAAEYEMEESEIDQAALHVRYRLDLGPEAAYTDWVNQMSEAAELGVIR